VKNLIQVIIIVLILLIFGMGLVTGASSTNHGTVTSSHNIKSTSNLLKPSDLVYQGAFRLPDDEGWEYGGSALAYYPLGDHNGLKDGYSGSLYATGHDWYQKVSEITIPRPIISKNKNVFDLKKAKTLQKFTDIKGNLFGYLEIPRVGLEYLPKQGRQKTGKLYYCWGQHMQEDQRGATHGWFDLNLRHPHVTGPWRIGGLKNYVTNGYIFSIPRSWADKYTPHLLLATGRFRDGGQGACGPSLFAYGPWNQGNPPQKNAIIKAVPLLLYNSVYGNKNYLKNYHHSDEWSGGAWLSQGTRSAVIFVGTKGMGDKCWYGFANGVVWPDHDPYPQVPDPPYNDRGWWSKGFQGQIIFYNPTQLALVARGKLKSYQPQPYTSLNIDPYLFNVKNRQQKSHVKGVTFDRVHGLLFVVEPFVDGDKPIVHVWKVRK
jgi:hypothetical protein